MTPTEAEICKIGVNGYITTKISYANLMGDLCKTLGCDPSVVLHAVGSDVRIGSKCFEYGYSFGGPCLPRDSIALGDVLKRQFLSDHLSQAVHDANSFHVEFQAKELLEKDLDVYVLEHVAYKENCESPFIEHSAKLKIGEYLARHGRRVVVKDKKCVVDAVIREYDDLFSYEIIP